MVKVMVHPLTLSKSREKKPLLALLTETNLAFARGDVKLEALENVSMANLRPSIRSLFGGRIGTPWALAE